MSDNEPVDKDTYSAFLAWQRVEDDRKRKRGAYWLSTEGREEIRETWDDPNDGNCVLPLLDALEAAEARLELFRSYVRACLLFNSAKDTPSKAPPPARRGVSMTPKEEAEALI